MGIVHVAIFEGSIPSHEGVAPDVVVLECLRKEQGLQSRDAGLGEAFGVEFSSRIIWIGPFTSVDSLRHVLLAVFFHHQILFRFPEDGVRHPEKRLPVVIAQDVAQHRFDVLVDLPEFLFIFPGWVHKGHLALPGDSEHALKVYAGEQVVVVAMLWPFALGAEFVITPADIGMYPGAQDLHHPTVALAAGVIHLIGDAGFSPDRLQVKVLAQFVFCDELVDVANVVVAHAKIEIVLVVSRNAEGAHRVKQAEKTDRLLAEELVAADDIHKMAGHGSSATEAEDVDGEIRDLRLLLQPRLCLFDDPIDSIVTTASKCAAHELIEAL